MTARKVLGITNRAQRPKPKKPHVDRPYSVSTVLEAHLRAWWHAARASRNAGCSALRHGVDYIGGTEDWPELLHIGALAQSASRGYHKAISKHEMGLWLGAQGVMSVKKTVHFRDHKGRVKYTTMRTFYVMG